ncbi:MAG TPA: adenylate/guanylate cyclase domain-containing protein [Alphaproteobacteria bacterium]|nr:adenylate/guanylate cyclase domain-containing protein [Alphaproteobacteria bacterium]
MVEQRVERKLSAILAADVAGYSRLIGIDEEGTLARLKACRRAVIDPKIDVHRGRIVKTTGDGMLVQFASIVDALRCAVEVQRVMIEHNSHTPEDRRIEFRMGVNIGDIIIDGDDIHGDGVNVAARLEGFSEPGGICVSLGVHDEVRDKLDLAFEDAGEQQLKNIARPVRVFRVRLSGPATKAAPVLALPDKPSIAVLPFDNLSGDPEQEYFADGVVEEIITALSRFRQLFVIARNSSFTYKGRAVDVKRVGRELGVRYVLEGSVRRAANRVRITGQLIDAATGAHLWADRFDGGPEDIFDLQDQVTASVVGAIVPKLEQAEIEWSRRKPTESLDAYDYYLRGLTEIHQWTKEANTNALSHFHRAVDLDSKFAAAYGWAARCYSQRKVSGWVTDPTQEAAEARRLARRAAECGRDDAVALCTAGIALAYVVGDLEDGAAFTDRALVLNPNLVWAWLFSGFVKLQLGEPEVAIERFARAMRLSPNDPQIYSAQEGMASAHFVAGRYVEALSWAKTVIREKPAMLIALCTAAASAALAGQLAEAQEAAARLRQLHPTWRISGLKEQFPEFGWDLAKFAEGLRMAGLPE